MSHNETDTPEEIQQLLKKVLDHFDKEDREIRERQMRLWKKLKFYWAGFQRIYWSEVAHDWRISNLAYLDSANTVQDNQFYDKQVNIFRAYLESIIAALSITIPPISCYPDDADNVLDLETAKAGDRIAALVFKHANAPYLWLHALFIYCTEGAVYAHNYTKCDKSYGTYKVDEYEDGEKEVNQTVCKICGVFPGDDFLSTIQRNTFGPDEMDAPVDNVLQNEGDICPNCGMLFIPELQTGKFPIKRLIGQRDEPKARQCIEVFGGLFVKTALYAKKQAETPYLIYSYETHYSQVLEKYPDLWDKFGKVTESSSNQNFEQWSRLSTQYMGIIPQETPTVRNAWFRPSAFNILTKSEAEKLRKLYPDGCKAVFVNDHFAEVCNEKLDDHWTITHNPLSDYLQFDPLGLLLVSIQDITNDLTALTLQTIEHGVPQTFVDPAVVDLEEYRASEVLVGGIYPAKPVSGKSVGDAFHEVKTAILSGEVLPFAERVQQMGQLTSGALPSLFGGAQPNSSKTAAQYSMSRAQALQRLQNTWKMLTQWWKDIFSKVIPAYMQDIVEDERNVIKGANGNFINVYIRKAQLEGKIGSVELEANENLPISWAQKKDVLMQLLQAAHPMVQEMLASPENLPLVAQAIGLEGFEVPGEDDRNKQHEEIRMLLETGPIVDPMSGQEMPSVPIDELVDDSSIHWDICRTWAVSEAGRLAKIENPEGYKNVLLHGQQHLMFSQMMAMQQQMQQSMGPQGNAAPGQEPSGNNDNDVPAAQQVKKNVAPE